MRQLWKRIITLIVIWFAVIRAFIHLHWQGIILPILRKLIRWILR